MFARRAPVMAAAAALAVQQAPPVQQATAVRSLRTACGTVVAVSTYKLSADPRLRYGTVLGPAARAVPAGHRGGRGFSLTDAGCR